MKLAFVTLAALLSCRSAPANVPAEPNPPSQAQTPSPGSLTVHEVGSSGRVVILLHGYGARGDDLVPFARELATSGAHFYLPEAPIVMPGGGRRWFGRQSEGAALDEVNAARRGVVALLERLAREGTPTGEVLLGGFSQGAMLSVDVAQYLAAEGKQLGGLLVLSGSTMPHWPADLGIRTRVLMTHGESDRVLSFTQAEQLGERLRAGGSEVHWTSFPGGHSIPPVVRNASALFIAAD